QLETISKPTDIILVLDQSGSMKGENLQALRTAVKSFVGDVKAQNQNLAASEKHRIAIAGFGSEEHDDHWQNSNTELLTVTGSNSGTVGKAYIDGLSATDYASSLVLPDNKVVDQAIAALDARGATRTDLGMIMANQILKNTEKDENGKKIDRNRAVILFTDGKPTRENTFNDGVANSAITSAAAIKKEGTTIYTIGLGNNFDQDISEEDATREGAGDRGRTNCFMRYVSSNYPAATSMDVPGEGGQWNGSYFKAAKDADSLKKIFDAIGQVIQKKTLNKDTVIQDIMSEFFALNTANEADIKTYISDYAGKNEQKQDTFKNKKLAEGVTVDITGGNVSVTGFDFEPVIADDEGKAISGKKLTIEIPVQLKQDAVRGYGGQWINSNNQENALSSIIHEKKTVQTFGVPQVLIPKPTIEITAASGSKVYDGSPLSNESYTYTQDVLASGDVLTAQVKAQAEGGLIDAGTAENKVTGYKIMRGDQDVTANYNVVTVSGSLTVSPRPVTLTSASDSKVYDGLPLTNHNVTATLTGSEVDGFVGNDGAVYNVTGSQKDAGSSDNEFTYTLNENTKAA
ncbi:MAG: VWA domain-containing protein, partial [Bacillota bacterium]|nr:VWA domain-containing protein [Bacillota bacterium]